MNANDHSMALLFSHNKIIIIKKNEQPAGDYRFFPQFFPHTNKSIFLSLKNIFYKSQENLQQCIYEMFPK